MQSLALLLLTTVVAVAMAEGEFYVPRAYYTIDAEGHASAPVPLRRLRRSLAPIPYSYGGGASANANANAEASAGGWGGGDATANANARADARSGYGGWGLPGGAYGASNPRALSAGQTMRQAGPVLGARSVSASTSVGIDGTGSGYYDQTASAS